MKTYQQLISELFDKPLKYKYTGNEDEAEYEFKTSSGNWYVVNFVPRKYSAHDKADFTPQMKKEFMQSGLDWNSAKDREKWIEQSKYAIKTIEIMFADDDDSTEITNAGSPIEVFSTVIAIIKDYIDAKEPESMVIESLAKEKSRVKLYRRLIKEFTRKYSEYKATEKDGGKYIVWYLEMK